ncbi:MAG: hypothetical protein KGL04_04415, partial [Elusimicrobia bacterium]|nr:hypothetical protein [Elusimicrobiota bacterium]
MLKILTVFLVTAAPVFAQSSPSDAGDAGSSSVQIGPQGQGVAIPGQNLDMGQNLGGSLEQSAIELPPVTPGVQTRIHAQV